MCSVEIVVDAIIKVVVDVVVVERRAHLIVKSRVKFVDNTQGFVITWYAFMNNISSFLNSLT